MLPIGEANLAFVGLAKFLHPSSGGGSFSNQWPGGAGSPFQASALHPQQLGVSLDSWKYLAPAGVGGVLEHIL